MVQPIMKDVIFLGQKSMFATKDDAQVAKDLRDTLVAHLEGCVGLAANMIGVRKNIIVFCDEDEIVVMFNPTVRKKELPYEAEESCLSLLGSRQVTRYKRIEVDYQDEAMHWHRKKYNGFTAQIIQHEIDHCNGIVI